MALTDLLIHLPPFTGPYPYSPPGNWKPDQPGFLAQGQSYVDPVFGQTVRRLTNVYPGIGDSEIYGKNDQWNANATWRIHDPAGAGSLNVIDATTGAIIRAGIPYGFLKGFDPNVSDIWFYSSGTEIRKYNVNTAVDELIKDFGATQTLNDQGGSVDWFDNLGRYFVVFLAGLNQVRLWDGISGGLVPSDAAYVPQAAGLSGLYTGAISTTIDGGWVGVAPDASSVVLAQGGVDNAIYYALNHGTQTVAAGVSFAPGAAADHGDLISASDGNTYICIFTGSTAPLPFVATNVATGVKRSLAPAIPDFCTGVHFSGVSRGPLRDWFAVGLEFDSGACPGQDDLTSTQATIEANWNLLRNEIVLINALTGDIRRLCHHRGRQNSTYQLQQRACVDRDGTYVAFASDYGIVNAAAYSDIYTVTVADDSGPRALLVRRKG